MISILKEYRPDFIYDENKPTNYICIRHFHPSVLYNDGKRDRVVLGGLPTINLADNYKEQSNAQRLVLSVVDRMELDIKMKRKSVEPLEVTPKMRQNSAQEASDKTSKSDGGLFVFRLFLFFFWLSCGVHFRSIGYGISMLSMD